MNFPKYEVASDIVSRVNQDGTVIIMKMDDSNNFFKINGIAAEIWNGLATNIEVDQLLINITNSYDVSLETAKSDTENLLKTLLDKKLLISKI